MRALLLILDSVGCGGAPDAADYGDEGADTLGHIFAGTPGLTLANVDALGLSAIMGRDGPPPEASWGRMRECSAGKDTTTGHWEIAGVILEKPFATFTRFPDDLVRAIEGDTGVTFLGNYPQSGTVILDELGAEHLRTGQPILYTSADSVLQIAAHEDVIPVEHLYEICRIARGHADASRIGRVIARPFIGQPGAWRRTARRHDFSFVPPRTVLNAIQDSGLPVRGVGKISDIFAGSGLSDSTPTSSNAEGMAALDRLWRETERGLIFTNLVDFDMLFGHRRDVVGYARALGEFDAWLPQFLNKVKPDDLVIITADHGNDPTWRGTDHTREEVPLLVVHQARAEQLGRRPTFSDIAASLAKYFQLPQPSALGTPFL
jgi:phosphopentomutase